MGIKQITTWAAIAAAVMVMFGAAAPTRAADKQLKIKLASLVPKGTSFHKLLQSMGEEWKAAPGGGVALTIYTDGTMGGEADMVRRMRIGQLQAGLITTAGLEEIDPSIAALQSIPMAYRSLDELDYVIEKMRPQLDQRMLAKGFVMLAWVDGGWVHFFTKRAVTTPAEFKTTKLFAWAGDPNMVQLIKDMGYSPVPLEPTDILTGLQTGLIDAVPSTPFYALAGQFDSAAPHMLKVNWAPLVGGIVMTKKSWDAMSPEMQAAVRKSAEAAGKEITKRGRAEAEESIDAMKKRGLTVHEPSAEVTTEWAKLAETTYPKMRGPVVPADVFDKVMELVKEHRASKGGK